MSAVMDRMDILKIRSFLLYFIGVTVSLFGTGMQFLANGWLAMELTDSGYSVAIILVCSAVPGIFLSPVIGVFVDRYDRRVLTVATDLMRAVVVMSIPVLWWMDMLEVWHLYLMSFFVAVGDQIYNPASQALVREVVPKDKLLQANSTKEIGVQFGSVIGTGVGGLVIAIASPITAMVFNAASFVVSAACIYFMRKGIVRPSTNGTARGFRVFIGQLREGISYIDKHRHIIILYMMVLFLLSTFRTINVLLAPFAKDVLQVGAVGFGIIDAAFAVGAVIGAFCLPMVTAKYGNIRTMTIAMGSLGVSIVVFAISQNLAVAVLGYIGIGLFYQVRTLYLTTAQHSIDLEFQGRVHSMFNTFFSIISLGLYLLMGYLGEIMSDRWVYGLQAVVMFIATGIAYQIFYRSKKEVDKNVYESA